MLTGCSTVIPPSHQLEIRYDYDTKRLDTPENGYKIRHGGTPTIIIDNINSMQFSVAVDEQQLTREYSAQAESSNPEKNEAGRNPANAGEALVDVPDSEKIRSVSALLSRTTSLVTRINTYINSDISFIENNFRRLVNSMNLPYNEIERQKNELTPQFIKLKKSLHQDYNAIIREYYFLAPQLIDASSEYTAVAAKEAELDAAYDQFQGIKLLDKVLSIDSLSSLLTQSNFRVVYNAPAAKADEILYTITIEPKDKNAAGPPKRVIPIPVRVAGNWKIDVSSGVLFNIGLTEQRYRFDAVGEDSVVLVKNKDLHTFTPTVGVMTHVYRKSPSYTNWGFSLGFGINDEQRVRYYGGLGVMLGESQRFVISGGLTAAPRAVLQGQYDEGQKFAAASVPASATEEVYRVGGFLSFTYNLTSSTKKAGGNASQE